MRERKLELDDFDRRLLKLLQADARCPVPELAETVGLSVPACYKRIRRLRETGAIVREIAVVKPKTLGWGVSMFVLVVLEREGSRTIADLLTKFSRHPQVIECANVTGEYDIAVRLVARDMEDYDDVAQALFVEDDRIRSFKTLVVIREGQPSKIAC